MTRSIDARILDQLFTLIAERGTDGDPKTSYTARLFDKGRRHIAKKAGEEAVEAVIAAVADSRDRLTAESADLLYHLLVLWAACRVEPADVWAELARRQGTSGLIEKSLRRPGQGTGGAD